MSEDRLIIFVRRPERGKVKTRLLSVLGEDKVLELYKCFVEDLLDAVGDFHPVIGFYPEDAAEDIGRWLGGGYDLISQTGADIGERMKNAFLRVFEDGCRRAVLIGSDLPDLPSEIIDEAFSSLSDHDAVIGPADDGGYYLIGFNKDEFLPLVFESMPWSTDEVLSRTVSILNQSSCRFHRLPGWKDIDRPEDLADLMSRNEGKPFQGSRTMSFLRLTGFERNFFKSDKVI